MNDISWNFYSKIDDSHIWVFYESNSCICYSAGDNLEDEWKNDNIFIIASQVNMKEQKTRSLWKFSENVQIKFWNLRNFQTSRPFQATGMTLCPSSSCNFDFDSSLRETNVFD